MAFSGIHRHMYKFRRCLVTITDFRDFEVVSYPFLEGGAYMIPFLLDGRTLIVIALVVVSLLLMIFAPQAMANLLGEPFSLVGRLVGTIADWLQKGADKLFALVKSVFLIGHPVEKD